MLNVFCAAWRRWTRCSSRLPPSKRRWPPAWKWRRVPGFGCVSSSTLYGRLFAILRFCGRDDDLFGSSLQIALLLRASSLGLGYLASWKSAEAVYYVAGSLCDYIWLQDSSLPGYSLHICRPIVRVVVSIHQLSFVASVMIVVRFSSVAMLSGNHSCC